MSIKTFVQGMLLKMSGIPATQGFTQSFFSSSSNQNKYTGYVYLAINPIKDTIAGTDILLYKKQSDGTKELIFDHPALKILDYVNDYGYTKFELFEKIAADLELEGNSYVLKGRSLGKSGIPDELFPLHAPCVDVVPHPEKYIAYYKYRIGGKTYEIPPEDMLHFRNYNPYSQIVGMSTLSAALVTVNTDEAAKLYNQKFFENNATPGVILQYPTSLTTETMNRLREQWDNEYKGFKKAYRTAVAAGGLQVIQSDVKHNDMQFIEGRKANRDEILSIFRVSPIIAGVISESTYAGAKAAEYQFFKYTILPKIQRIVNVLNEFLLPDYGDERLEYDFVDKTPVDVVEKTAYYTQGINNGWLSLNDVRRAENLPELEDGEEVFLPLSLSPYSQPKAKSVSGDVTIKNAAKKLVDILSVKSVKQETLYGGKWTSDEFDAKGEKKVADIRARMRKYERQATKLSLQLFEDQKNRVIKNLSSAKSIVAMQKSLSMGVQTKVGVEDVFDIASEIKITVDLFSPLFKTITDKEGKEALVYLGLDPDEFDVDSPDIKEMLRANTIKFAGVINQKTSDDIRRIITEGLSEGEAIAGLTKRIQEYSGFGKHRATVIARSETIRAHGKAEVAAWEASEVVTSKVWYTALDERVCPDCNSQHGKQVDLTSSFLTVSQQRELGLSVYDGAIDAPPLHPQCRCTIIPIVK